MSLFASVLSALVLFLPAAFPGLAFVGAAPFALAALPWLALAPLARRPAGHLAVGLPVLGLGLGLELAAGASPAILLVRAAEVLTWGVLLAMGRRGPRAGVALLLAVTAVLLFLGPATSPGTPGGPRLALLTRLHPLAVAHAWASAGPPSATGGPPAEAAAQLLAGAGPTAVVLLLALLVRVAARSREERS